MDGLEIVDKHVIKMCKVNFEPSNNGIGFELFYSMKSNETLLAQIDTHTDEHDFYDKFLLRCTRTAIHLQEHKVQPHDVICISSYNHINSCVPYLAGMFIGAVVCCLDPTLSASDTRQLILQIKPRIIFVVPENRDLYNELITDESLDVDLIVFETEGENSFHRFLKRSSKEHNFVPAKVRNVHDTAAIVFSSGTTGLAKGICLDHHTLHAKAATLSPYVNIERYFVCASLHWAYGVSMLINGIIMGTTRVLARSFNPGDTWKTIAKSTPTLVFMPSHLAIAMVKEGKPHDLTSKHLLSVENVLMTGGAMPLLHLLKFRRLLPHANIFQVYGLSEIAGIAMLFRPRLEKDLILLRTGNKSCGKPIPGFSYKVVSLNSERTVGFNEIGELRIKSATPLSSYHDTEFPTAWDHEGWLKTGDICYYDEDYCFYLVDRIKDIITFNTHPVSSIALECILIEHAAVKEVAVIGVAERHDGEHPLGVVVLDENVTDVTEQMLQEYVDESVNDMEKMRGGVQIVDSLPSTPIGSIRKFLLRDVP